MQESEKKSEQTKRIFHQRMWQLAAEALKREKAYLPTEKDKQRKKKRRKMAKASRKRNRG